MGKYDNVPPSEISAVISKVSEILCNLLENKKNPILMWDPATESLLTHVALLLFFTPKNSFVSMYLTYQFSKIIKCGTDLSDIAGYASRLGQLMEALNDLSTEMENIAIDFPHEESVSSDSSIRCENLSLSTPTGEVIVNSKRIVLFLSSSSLLQVLSLTSFR